jgi:hypothetical protein
MTQFDRRTDRTGSACEVRPLVSIEIVGHNLYTMEGWHAAADELFRAARAAQECSADGSRWERVAVLRWAMSAVDGLNQEYRRAAQRHAA